MDIERIRFRRADASDAEPIALLHADSWRRHYRGAYSDMFLDGDVARDRLAVWTSRLGTAGSDSFTIMAEDDRAIAGFAHTALDRDATWGALLDNLHVTHTHQRSGIGSKLLVLSAGTVVQRRPQSRLYLWVLEQNRAAQAFYAALGGKRAGREIVEPPGGDPRRLNGNPVKLRYVWSDPATLLR